MPLPLSSCSAMAGEAKAGAGRPARTQAAESQVTDDASRGQPKRKPEAEPMPLPVTKPVIALVGLAAKYIMTVYSQIILNSLKMVDPEADCFMFIALDRRSNGAVKHYGNPFTILAVLHSSRSFYHGKH